MHQARTTKDIDLTLESPKKLNSEDGAIVERLREELQDQSAEDLGDYFVFLIGEPMMDIDAAPYGGARYPIDARMDGRSFIKFHLDVGVGDIVLLPTENLEAHDWLGFTGIKPPMISLLSKEQQFSEKLHAYTLPERQSPNSRVKDLVRHDNAHRTRRDGIRPGQRIDCRHVREAQNTRIAHSSRPSAGALVTRL